MTIQRKTPPTPVAWDQQNILARLRDLESAVANITSSTVNPLSDSSATVVRNVRDYEILSAIAYQTEVLERIEQQLIILNL